MTTTAALVTPGLESYLSSLKTQDLETSIESLISLFKRRQIRGSRECAEATARVLMQVVRRQRHCDSVALLERVRAVGAQLTQAQPREIAVGNIVRRVLGVIHDEADESHQAAAEDALSEMTSESGTRTPWDETTSPLHSTDLATALSTGMGLATAAAAAGGSTSLGSGLMRPSLLQSGASLQPSVYGSVASMFDLLSASQTNSPGTQSPATLGSPRPGASFTHAAAAPAPRDIKGEVLQGIEELIDELASVDDQIAAYAPEHIHSAETILVYGASTTVQKFLLRAAAVKRQFTVIHAEAYPNGHWDTYRTVTGKRPRLATTGASGTAGASGWAGTDGDTTASTTTGTAIDEDDEDEDSLLAPQAFTKPLIAAGITVVLIPDAALFALMARVNKVLLGTHVVLANGGLVAAAGVRAVAQAARAHRVPVVVVSGVYKLSPLYPFDFEALIEHGDAGSVVPFQEAGWVGNGSGIGRDARGGQTRNAADGAAAHATSSSVKGTESMPVDVDTINPLFDYVPPELVDLYVTNLGGHAPSYLYRIVAEHYRKEDASLGY